jgi:hypothetical protein
MSIRRRVEGLERRTGRPGEKPAAVLLYDARPRTPGDKPAGPFTHAATGETFPTLEAAGERYGAVLLLPRKDTTGTRPSGPFRTKKR